MTKARRACCEGDAVVLGRAARLTQVDATGVAPFKSDTRRGGDSGRAARLTQVDATDVAPFKSDARRGGDSGRAAPFKSNATDVAPFKSDA